VAPDYLKPAVKVVGRFEQQQGKPISVEDAQIASIARANRLSLATRNGKDFANIEGLVVLNFVAG